MSVGSFFLILYAFLGIFFNVKIGEAIDAKAKLTAAQGPKTISQLIIVYSPMEDHNGAFYNFDESLTDLFEAAKKRNLRIVLIDADSYQGPSANDMLKDAIKDNVTAKPSFVILAAHGDQIKNQDGTTDTSLSFSGKITFSDLSKSFNNPNFSGLLVDSCHSENSLLPSLGEKTITCATAKHEKEGSSETLKPFENALSTLIDLGGDKSVVSFMKGAVLAQTKNLKNDTKESLLGDSMELANIPIYGPANYNVEFSGKKYEIVDPLGKPIFPCYARLKANGFNTDVGKRKIASLPSKYIPPDIVDKNFSIFRQLRSRMQPYYFDHHPQNYGMALLAECNNQGQIEIKNRSDQCEKKIYFGKDCRKSFISILEKQKVEKNQKPPVFPKIESVANEYCQTINKDMKVWESKGFKIQAKYICATQPCLFTLKNSAETYFYGWGQCSKTGGICLPTPAGSYLFYDEKCLDLMKVQEKQNKCIDQEGKEIPNGQCFTPAGLPEELSRKLPPPSNQVFWNFDRNEALLLASTQISAYKCGKNPDGGGDSYYFDVECCGKSGGLLVPGRVPSEETTTSNQTDFSAHLDWLHASTEAITTCRKEKKQDASKLPLIKNGKTD